MKKIFLVVYLLLVSIFVFANNINFEDNFNSSNTVIAKMPAGNFEGNPIYKPSENEIKKALKATGKSIQENIYQFPDFETVLEHINEFKLQIIGFEKENKNYICLNFNAIVKNLNDLAEVPIITIMNTLKIWTALYDISEDQVYAYKLFGERYYPILEKDGIQHITSVFCDFTFKIPKNWKPNYWFSDSANCNFGLLPSNSFSEDKGYNTTVYILADVEDGNSISAQSFMEQDENNYKNQGINPEYETVDFKIDNTDKILSYAMYRSYKLPNSFAEYIFVAQTEKATFTMFMGIRDGYKNNEKKIVEDFKKIIRTMVVIKG
ncbi:hypothetical protein H0R92_07490 [Treponema sp. OMZ 840]|uniref:hypothetical protein n=1 Tax=Treponema sp. OMZ 840 TaxID=244313 RepID=UPI003D8D96FB